ncbi:hypothetical protein GQ43DRAFT_454129 [Delitschia confertaspora ATCC 74209]|uniref:Uncharacterized protein n=1 Tax=Delitschia confertaspora ATCC 74209 TaxID=1513339 RepID=A0A9P4MY48_9PLEO|nr:hypothetical protein GQ43DRAFT_454129 [Delitschia confertaspora ATCC 74209]
MGLDLYGKILVSTEGATWRMHRILTAPNFNDRNIERVFLESFITLGNRTLENLAIETIRHALYVISRAGFGVRVGCPHEEDQTPKGKSPFQVPCKTGTAPIKWGKYSDELYEVSKDEVASGEKTEGIDLQLIRNQKIFRKSDLCDNAFVILLTGYETAINTLHYVLKRLQEYLDNVLQGRALEGGPTKRTSPVSLIQWWLRLLLFRINSARSLQTVLSHSQLQYIGRTGNPMLNDVNNSKPERRLPDSTDGVASEDLTTFDDEEELRGSSDADTSALLFKPVKGPFIPFSDGYCSSVGQRSIQVELLVALAIIFREYSVELVMDQFANDAGIEAIPKGEKKRKDVWQKTADRPFTLYRSR